MGRYHSTFKWAGRALGFTSVYEHGNKALEAYRNKDYANAVINGGKVALDIVLMVGKASNPFVLFGGLAYTIWDMSGTMQW